MNWGFGSLVKGVRSLAGSVRQLLEGDGTPAIWESMTFEECMEELAKMLEHVGRTEVAEEAREQKHLTEGEVEVGGSEFEAGKPFNFARKFRQIAFLG